MECFKKFSCVHVHIVSFFTVAISGSQQELVEPFAKRYGFDMWVGQQWERDGEFFTGSMKKTHTGKDKILKRIVEEHNLTMKDSYAVGDSNGDSGMLSIVDNAVAFNPTYELYEKAVAHGWKIVIERKNISYELTGDANATYQLEHAYKQ